MLPWSKSAYQKWSLVLLWYVSLNDRNYSRTYDVHVAMDHCVSTPKIYELYGVVSWTSQAEDEGSELGRVELYHSREKNIYRIGVRKSTGKTRGFIITSQTSLTRLTEDSIKINELQYRYTRKPVPSTVNVSGASPNEVQKFIDKLPDCVKEKMQDLRGALYMQRPLSAGEHHAEKVPRQSREMLEDKENLQRQERGMQEREQRQQREQNCQSELRELQQRHGNLQLRYSNEIQRLEQRQRQLQQDFQSQLRAMQQQKDNLQEQFNEMQRREQRQLSEKQQLEQAFQSQLTELRQRGGNLRRQLTDLQQREQNFQGRLSAAQRREENLQRELNEMQQREQNFQGQLTEMRQQEGNLRRQLTEMQERERGFENQLQQRERDFESLRSEMRQGEESLQRRLNELHIENSELQLSLSTAQQTLNDSRRQETRDWVISRDEIHVTDKLLGRGGWASVYEGVYCGCPVAVKQIYDLILSDHNIRLFEREMSIASKCRHPHLLQFVGATNDRESPLFVTELMMKSLRDLLHERELLVEEIHVLCLDIARALNYLHQKKPVPIIHRDVSSANVLLWRQGDQWRGKVSDYGTANFMQQTMTVGPGAMIYSAPESSTPNQTVKVDVYSFGVLLCEMFIRELPDPTRREEQVVRVKNGTFRSLVRRCLPINPESRPSMEEIINYVMRLNAEL